MIGNLKFNRNPKAAAAYDAMKKADEQKFQLIHGDPPPLPMLPGEKQAAAQQAAQKAAAPPPAATPLA